MWQNKLDQYSSWNPRGSYCVATVDPLLLIKCYVIGSSFMFASMHFESPPNCGYFREKQKVYWIDLHSHMVTVKENNQSYLWVASAWTQRAIPKKYYLKLEHKFILADLKCYLVLPIQVLLGPAYSFSLKFQYLLHVILTNKFMFISLGSSEDSKSSVQGNICIQEHSLQWHYK